MPSPAIAATAAAARATASARRGLRQVRGHRRHHLGGLRDGLRAAGAAGEVTGEHRLVLGLQRVQRPADGELVKSPVADGHARGSSIVAASPRAPPRAGPPSSCFKWRRPRPPGTRRPPRRRGPPWAPPEPSRPPPGPAGGAGTPPGGRRPPPCGARPRAATRPHSPGPGRRRPDRVTRSGTPPGARPRPARRRPGRGGPARTPDGGTAGTGRRPRSGPRSDAAHDLGIPGCVVGTPHRGGHGAHDHMHHSCAPAPAVRCGSSLRFIGPCAGHVRGDKAAPV